MRASCSAGRLAGERAAQERAIGQLVFGVRTRACPRRSRARSARVCASSRSWTSGGASPIDVREVVPTSTGGRAARGPAAARGRGDAAIVRCAADPRSAADGVSRAAEQRAGRRAGEQQRTDDERRDADDRRARRAEERADDAFERAADQPPCSSPSVSSTPSESDDRPVRNGRTSTRSLRETISPPSTSSAAGATYAAAPIAPKPSSTGPPMTPPSQPSQKSVARKIPTA